MWASCIAWWQCPKLHLPETAWIIFHINVYTILHTLFPGWLTPDTCVASDCQLRQPLLPAELSPNLLLILIHSSANGRSVRDAIRQTWLSGVNNQQYSPIQYRWGNVSIPYVIHLWQVYNNGYSSCLLYGLFCLLKYKLLSMSAYMCLECLSRKSNFRFLGELAFCQLNRLLGRTNLFLIESVLQHVCQSRSYFLFHCHVSMSFTLVSF